MFNYLLTEDGYYLLLETEDKIILEGDYPSPSPSASLSPSPSASLSPSASASPSASLSPSASSSPSPASYDDKYTVIGNAYINKYTSVGSRIVD